MTKTRKEAIKKYWTKAKAKCPFNDETIQNGYLEGFIDGATEVMKEHKWHDLRKNPKDLPKDDKDVLVYSGEEWRMCVGKYSPKHKSWEAGCDTVEWMEIPEVEN